MPKKTNNVAGVVGADPTLPKVDLVIGGKTYHLAFDFNAIVKADEATGVNLLVSVMGTVNAVTLRGLLWAALLKDQPEITLDEVGSLIAPYNIATIRTAITTAWFGSVKDQKDQDNDSGEEKETPRK